MIVFLGGNCVFFVGEREITMIRTSRDFAGWGMFERRI